MSARVLSGVSGNTLVLRGDVTPDNVMSVRKEGEALITGMGASIIADLSETGAAHSVVLSLLLCWSRCAAEQQKSFQVAGAGVRLRALASLCGFEPLIPGFA